MKLSRFLFIPFFCCNIVFANSQDHENLRKLKSTVIDLINSQNFDGLSSRIHNNIVVTAENNQVVRGKEELEKFYKNLLINKEAPLEKFEIRKFEVDELSILYHNHTAIAFGDMECYFKLKNGTENIFQTRWTATLIREADLWRLAAFHNSVDFTNNPLTG